MLKKDYEKGDEIELDQINIILKIPKKTIALEIQPKILDDNGEVMTLSATLDPEDVRAARQDFLDNVDCGDDYDALYTLTDKGRELCERIQNGDPDAIRELDEVLK